jgi:DNA-binding response OmpR family regulator
MDPFEEIRRLREENQELKEQIKDLRYDIDDDATAINNIARHFKIAKVKSTVLYRLACGKGRVIAKWLLHENTASTDVYLCRLRRMFGPTNIETIWGVGHSMRKELCEEILTIARGENV